MLLPPLSPLPTEDRGKEMQLSERIEDEPLRRAEYLVHSLQCLSVLLQQALQNSSTTSSSFTHPLSP